MISNLIAQGTIDQVTAGTSTPLRQAQALNTDDIRAIVDVCMDHSDCVHQMQGLRDRAFILTGFCSGLRRKPLSKIQHHQIEFHDAYMKILIPSDKTDQAGIGRSLVIMRQTEKRYCPVTAMREWLTASKIKSGPVFRPFRAHSTAMRATSIDATSLVLALKKRARQAGLSPHRISGHSLRRGMATEARRRGKHSLGIQQHGGWTSTTMLARYTSEADQTLPENNPSYDLMTSLRKAGEKAGEISGKKSED